MTARPRTLDDLRIELDSIDTQLHELIMRRGALASEIAAIKARDDIERVRPGREAVILRRLAAGHKGAFPAGALLRIWREVIASITRMEMPEYKIAVFAAEDEQGCWDLARDQFGSRTPMTLHASPRDVVAQVFEGAATLGVVPYPTEDDSGSWWTSLCVVDAPQVVYRMPFFGRGNARGGQGDAPDALAIGRISAEPTGDDHSVLVVESPENLSRGGVGELLESTGFKSSFHASRKEDAWLHYAEVEGFITPDDPRLEALGGRDSVDRVSIIGAYPTPMPDVDAVPADEEEASS
jgi:chorismate mutase